MGRLVDSHTRPFFELLQVAVGNRATLTHLPSAEEEWVALVKEAEQQGLLGVFYSAIQVILPQVDIPMVVYFSLEKAARKIEEKNKKCLELFNSLSRFFAGRGYRTCLLKGQAAGVYYPNPLLRQSGDVDIWVEGSRGELVSLLRKHFPVRKVVYHHCAFLESGLQAEVHFTPSWMNDFRANRRLQRWFASVADKQFSQGTTPAFNAVYFLIHIYRHVLEEGIGLRQMLDYYYVLQHLDEADKEKVRQDLTHLHLLRFAGSLMYVLQEVFLLDDKYLLCPPDPKGGEYLLESTLMSGNFGWYDASNAHSVNESLPAHVRRKLRRNFRLLLRFPSEVLSMPFFMLWQYVWRLMNGYLYHGR